MKVMKFSTWTLEEKNVGNIYFCGFKLTRNFVHARQNQFLVLFLPESNKTFDPVFINQTSNLLGQRKDKSIGKDSDLVMLFTADLAKYF